MGWSEKYKKSINCNNPKGFSQKAHCAGKKKNEDMVFEEITEDILNEKLITYGNRKPYGQIVFMAGGAGSGKGFAIKNFVDSASFKIRDVDEMKKQLQILNRLGKLDIRSILKKYGRNIKLKDLDLIRKIEKDGYKLQNLNLKNPDHVYALHILVKAMGIKDSSLEKLLLGKNNPETLPNILFDITAKDVTDITNVIPKLKAVGYKPENIHLTWVLTNYVTSLENNKNRSRMVPDGSMGSENIMLKTHEGAANTIWGLVTKALPKGMNGRVDVILNNPENTVFVKGVDGKDLEKTQKDNKGNDVKVKFTSGFLSLPLKKEKGGIFSEKVWKNKLFNWVKDNAPDSITANMKESVNEGKVDRVVGHTRYKYVGDGRKGQAIVSGPMKDREKEAIIKRAKKAGYNAKPNMGGGVTIHVESVNEAMKPSQVRSTISKVKKGLMRKWKQKGGYENFGQKELSQMKDKFDYNPYGSPDERQISKMLDGFNDWAMNYDGNMREATLSQIHKAAKKGSYPVSIVATMLGKVVKQELVKTPMAVPAAFMGMQGAYPKAKISVESRTGQILFQEMSISMGESINEYLSPSDVDSTMKEFGIKKIPISSQGERILKGMKKEGFIKKVTNKERLIYFYESLGKEKFGYGVKEKPLSPLVSRYSNDISSEAIFFGGKMAAWNVVTNIKDRLANREEVDSTYYMLKNYFDSFGMDTNRSRVFKSATFQVDEWLKRNKKIAQQIGENTMVNEISAINGLKQVVKGNTKEVEGIKVSKEMAQAMIDWFNSSPYGRKYPRAKNARLHISIGVMLSFGLDRYAKHKGAKEELKYLKSMKESVNEAYGEFIKAKNLNDIIKLSKQKKNATFYVTDDNNSRIGAFYLKNGKFAKATSANPNYDLQRNKTKLKDRSDVIYKYKVDESVVNESLNEAKYKVGDNVTVTLKGGNKVYKGKVEKINPLRIRTSPSDVTVLGNHMIQSVVKESINENPALQHTMRQMGAFGGGSKKKKKVGVVPPLSDFVKDKTVKNPETKRDVKVSTAIKDKNHPAHKQAKSLWQRLKDKLKGENLSVNEGKKRFKRQDGIGKAKYTVSYHDGKKKHKDGSDFFDIKIFKNKKDLSDFVGTLAKQGYKHESVNESVASLIDQIRQDSKDVKDFVKNIFKDSEFKKMSNDKDFIKYLKSIYEGINENDNVITLEERVNLFFEENIPTNPSKWSYYTSQAKKKFDVYPSAYANGWAAKQYKAAGGGWRKKK